MASSPAVASPFWRRGLVLVPIAAAYLFVLAIVTGLPWRGPVTAELVATAGLGEGAAAR
ncbi:hypothetical protein [Prosthecomicrobium pneumaticum]|uniref:Uncharacterized protein n=1 Tax=Prosthecomicrobium pneumaticum TaxID=81895 RepID=A0A7W9FMV9_9HYPH|nr:hypothetical protein [Prosthecomicrobium pneumaticum]MBB5753528.1 hypothetical protein [Prosthecomicrobium pneumaticum]